MKRNTLSGSLIFALVAAAVLGAAPTLLADGHPCSLKSVAGDYGYTSLGLRGSLSVAAVGLASVDKDGNIVGKQTLSFGGTIGAETYTGTWNVNGDCTGSATIIVTSFNPALNRTSTLDVVWTEHSRHVRMIFTNAGTVITLEGEKIGHDDD